eukprot:TRINITY_DN3960_c0_g1_i2.p1 TRINITY_DN3960_c0_g1~~TRINITY_DN3960_c0_g1_i2.p1  ORF type:complete len:121 (-),score=13.51 TRINITY_DN3960_c0_g1_i2:104-466(-)
MCLCVFQMNCCQEGSPYEGFSFPLLVIFPERYPHEAPDVKFTIKVYHPNVTEKGEVCTALLNDWKASTKMSQVLKSIIDLMAHPNPDDPAIPVIGEKYKNDRAGFNATARAWSVQYATAL